MGRKPAPTHLKLVKGNPGRRPISKAEPKPERAAPNPPTHLSDKAREAWDVVVAMLSRSGVLTLVDAIAVEMLCEAYADYHSATAELETFGSNYYTTTNQAGSPMHRAHPALAARRDADRRIKAWLAEFGMTPSARTRVNAAPEGSKQKDPAEKYF